MFKKDRNEGELGAPKSKVCSLPFKVNPFTGAGQYVIPLAVTASRDLAPELALVYNSNSVGSGLFGMGFELPMAKIYRSTAVGFPLYDERDRFILTGEEDLIKKSVLTCERPSGEWRVTTFHPYIGSRFNSIEFWQAASGSDNYWLVRDNNGVNHIFGKMENARIADPANSARIFTWLLEQSYDSKGNKILYTYDKEENDPNRYLKLIRYGNYYKDPKDLSKGEDFAYQIQFNYQRNNNPAISYRSGFAIKTGRLCHEISLLHQIGQELSLVKKWALGFEEDQKTGVVLLNTLQEQGFRKLSKTGEILSKSAPAVVFKYSPLDFKPDFLRNSVAKTESNYMHRIIYNAQFSELLNYP